MNNLTTIHTTNALKRIDNTVSHQTDAKKRKETGLVHSTDVYKIGSPIVIHSTNAFLEKANSVSHSTSANKLRDPLVSHSTDALLKSAGGLGGTEAIAAGSTGEALSAYSQLSPETTAEFSKNAPLYVSIGGGLSSMIGLPRIATWNTLGRPAKPKRGTMGFNTETKRLEAWNGYIWYIVPLTRV